MNVSDYIVERIRSIGVDVVFGLPGVHALALWNALEKSGLRYIGFRHEHAAAHAADGYGRAKGLPGVLFLSTGPGALNALSALGEAYVSSSPVIAITSAIPNKYFGRRKGFLHDSKNLQPAFEAVTRYSTAITDAGVVPKALDEAITAALGQRNGPALLEIPVDILDEDLDVVPSTLDLEPKAPDASDVGQAGLLLSLAARPVIWAGGGVIRSRASQQLVTLAERLNAPVVTTFMGKGAIPEDHQLCVGAMVRQPETAKLLSEADVLLAVGTRFSAMSTSNWKLNLPSQLIHIDIDPEEIGRNYPVRQGIVGDAGITMQHILAELDKRGASANQQGAPLARSAREAAFQRAESTGPREMAILRAIRKSVPRDVIFVNDMTIPSYWSAPFFEITVPGTFQYPYGYGSLGYSLPAAIGASAATPGKPVVSFSGDGGFQYHSRELATIAEHSLPITSIVFNDSSWGVLKAFSEARYSKTFGMDLPGPDFVALAKAHGIDASRVKEPEELAVAVKTAISSGEPALIEVQGSWKLPPPSDYYR